MNPKFETGVIMLKYIKDVVFTCVLIVWGTVFIYCILYGGIVASGTLSVMSLSWGWYLVPYCRFQGHPHYHSYRLSVASVFLSLSLFIVLIITCLSGGFFFCGGDGCIPHSSIGPFSFIIAKTRLPTVKLFFMYINRIGVSGNRCVRQ